MTFSKTLYQGDCVEVLKGVPFQSVDFIITDPPFNVKLEYDSIDDFVTDEKYADWCKQWFLEFRKVLKLGHYGVVFSGDKKLWYLQKGLIESGLKFHHFLKWHKPQCQRALSGTVFFNRTELGLVFSNGQPNTKLIQRKKLYSDTITCRNTQPNDNDSVEHNARRPVELYQKIIEGFTKEGDTVLDCFMGSGTSFLAAVNRNVVGIELSEEYCQLIKKRCFGVQTLDSSYDFQFNPLLVASLDDKHSREVVN